jgi:DNA repair photolyase
VIQEIKAKVLLSQATQPDPWFGLKYTMNLYRGCQHQCIYCDSRSECYQIENFADILVKVNAVDLLRVELARKRVKGLIGTGSMHDPYMPLEKERRLTRRALEVIAEFGFPVHVTTKSDLVLRDADLLQAIKRVYATVSFTITTADDALGKKVEPGAPLVSARFRAMAELAEGGIHVGVTMMPILPFIEDDEDNLTRIVSRAHECGASYIIPWFGMSLRDRQRAYYYQQLDRLFPGLKRKYQRRFGQQYHCSVDNARQLESVFDELRQRYGFETRVKPYTPVAAAQLSLF